MIDITLVQIDPFHYFYQERSCGMDPDEISACMGEVFEAVGTFMADAGVHDIGHPLSVYPVYSPDQMIFRAGYVVPSDEAQKAEGNVHAGTITECRVLHYVHQGPYSTLRDSYAELMSYAKTNGLALTSPAWEVYLKAPDEVASEDELRTAVYVSLGHPRAHRRKMEVAGVSEMA